MAKTIKEIDKDRHEIFPYAMKATKHVLIWSSGHNFKTSHIDYLNHKPKEIVASIISNSLAEKDRSEWIKDLNHILDLSGKKIRFTDK